MWHSGQLRMGLVISEKWLKQAEQGVFNRNLVLFRDFGFLLYAYC